MATLFRLRVIVVIILVIASLIILRLFYWQIIRGPGLRLRADKQHQEVVVLASQRGDILDRQGELLAGTQNLYHLFVYKPELTKEKGEVARLIAPFLSPESSIASVEGKIITQTELIEQTRLALQDRMDLVSNWVSLRHYLDFEQKKKIESLNIGGIGFEDELTRFYPEASLAAQILGFVGSDLAGQSQGYFGLEGFYDRQMRGREGRVSGEKDAFGAQFLSAATNY